ncbi:MAG: FecR family protein [Methylobacter sp.]|nr:FecR family protein [Methylobacter sp.]
MNRRHLELAAINSLPPVPESIFEEASAWFIRLHAEHVNDQEQLEFNRWLTANPQHAQAWNEVQDLYLALETPAKNLRQAAVQAPTTLIAPSSQRQNLIPLRAAAALLLCTALTFFLQPATLQNLQSDYHTATGEQRQIDLADGSKLLLNTDSAVTVEIEDNVRRVQLLRGEAYFQVAHAPERPFWVNAGAARARVTGTAFSVGRNNDNVTITVAEGRVETSATEHPEQITPLTPGETARYQNQQLAAKQTTEVQRTLAWRQGQIVFVQATLSEVVDEINRYRPGRLIITNEQLKNRPITAVFSVNRLDDAVTALEQTFGIRARRLTDYLVLLG